jgi:hypothetical protein
MGVDLGLGRDAQGMHSLCCGSCSRKVGGKVEHECKNAAEHSSQ